MSEAAGRALRVAAHARRALECRRLLRAAARGAVPGAALGVVAMTASRLLPAVGWLVPLAWALPAACALAGTLRAAMRARVSAADAALWLDRALGTRERIVTLLTRPDHPAAARVAAGLPAVLRLPAIPLPRELALVPAMLFVLFALGLLPMRVVQAAGPGPVVARTLPASAEPAASPAASEPGKESALADEALEALARSEVLAESVAADTAALLDRRLARPEDRAEARAVLDAAQAGAPAARERLAALLRELEGRGGVGAPAAEDGDPAAGPSGERGSPAPAEPSAARAAPAYPEMIDVLRAYRRALAEE